MGILETGTALLSEKLGLDLDAGEVAAALSGLLTDDRGELDLAGLVSRMMNSGDLGAIVGSWLGDGANEAISAESISSIFGTDKLGEFAGKLGVDIGAATDGLAEALPEMLDKSSSGGSLLDLAGGAGGLLGAARSLFS